MAKARLDTLVDTQHFCWSDKMAYFGENWDDNEFPLAYLITVRTFGTWLHGDERFSVDAHDDFNVYGAPKRSANKNLLEQMKKNMISPAIELNSEQRIVVAEAIKEVCSHRGYNLLAQNVRTNHFHGVVSATVKPEQIANGFKSCATRKLRECRLIDGDERVWSRGRSRRYLWKDKDVSAAIEYVLYCQGDFSFEDWYDEYALI